MRLFVFGIGYSAQAFIWSRRSEWSRVAGTVRSADKARRLMAEGIRAYSLSDGPDASALADEIGQADAILVSAPPAAEVEPTLTCFRDLIASASKPAWIGYLSTTGVYGDHGGAWVGEETPATPMSRQSEQRFAAERAWLDLGRETGKAVHIFRLAGIYGPGRNALANLAQGTAKRIVKPGQSFNRIHVDDIAAVLAASLGRPRAGAVYNVADDEPAPPQDVVTYAAHLAGVAPPPEIPFHMAELSPMGLGFYTENKRISNRLIKEELGARLLYPNYREGLDALFAAGEFAQVA
jgi:nucleoside-diphosphate-sugar epimerase